MSRTVAQSDGGDRYATLDLGEFERARPRVTVMPAPTLFSVAADVAGAGRGSPPDWIAAARAELEPIDMGALAPIGIRGFSLRLGQTIARAAPKSRAAARVSVPK